ncbi:MAG: hypothetical protein Q4D98_06380 [Planctomycetia bacterium]|nr:hypothetical protein [Planctomycetia bacterium]
MQRLWILLVMVCLVGTGNAEVPRKKLIELGWDIPTTQYLREHWEEMERTTPFDGVIYTLNPAPGRKGADSQGLFSKEHPWDKNEYAKCLEDMKACRFTKFTDNFIRVNFHPGDTDWDDDAGWKVILDKVSICAWIAKQSGSKGLCLDFESYGYPMFRYSADSGRTFAEMKSLAKKRGAELLQTVAKEFPDATLLALWLNSINRQAGKAVQPDLVLQTSEYGLLPAFINGMLSVLPKEMVLVDGCEKGYMMNSPSAFQTAALDMVLWTGTCAKLVEPEYRQTYRSQVQCGFGVYLDMYTNDEGTLYYRVPEGREKTRLDRFMANLGSAVASADQYVWVYGEKNRWWNVKKDNPKMKTWEAALPGITVRMNALRDPFTFAKQKRESLKSDPAAKNLLKNPDFSQKNPNADLPAEWAVWQNEKTSHGTFHWKENRAVFREMEEGCFIQGIPVHPGEVYLLYAKGKATGKATLHLTASWKTAEDKWTRWDASTRLDLDSSGTEIFGLVTVPEEAGRMIVLPSISGQGADDTGEYEKVEVYLLN